MMDYIKFKYREFYDLPRMLFVEYGKINLLFVSRFVESIDEYSDSYEVFQLRDFDKQLLEGDWNLLETITLRMLGSVKLKVGDFDPSRRNGIEETIVKHYAEMCL